MGAQKLLPWLLFKLPMISAKNKNIPAKAGAAANKNIPILKNLKPSFLEKNIS